MDDLYECAKAFEKLLNIQYKCSLGKRNEKHDITIGFTPYDFKHLAGLQYIKDSMLYGNAERVFKNILSGKITLEILKRNSDVSKVEQRIKYLKLLENFIDSNELIFKFDKNRHRTVPQAIYTKIAADYLLKNYDVNETPLFFFIVENKDKYVGISFFADVEKDYAKGQTAYALLYKEKVNLITGEKIIQFDRLKERESLDSRLARATQKQEAYEAEREGAPKRNHDYDLER